MGDKSSVEKQDLGVAPEKLANKKIYRTVNIDVLAEEAKEKEARAVLAKVNAKKNAKSQDKDIVIGKMKSKEDYKAVLKGMGFKVD